jgi:predicted alpha/beta superfamily hydrolase
MINIKFFIPIFILFLVSCSSQTAEKIETKNQPPTEIITKYTELRSIVSKEVNDTFYVYVRLPKHYKTETKSYPVLYLLDGDIAFDMSTSIIRYLQYAEDVPDIIIIGIGYGTMLNDNNLNFRERDYSFTNIPLLKYGSGGADNYLKFLKNELIPYVEKNYRTNKNRILDGYSLGGLFSIYTLLKDNNLFTSYIAGSPYLKENLDSLITLSKKIGNLNNRVFITVGETEDNKNFHYPIEKIYSTLRRISKDKSNIKMVEFKNGTHFTCPAEALTYGMKFVFQREMEDKKK